MEPEVIVNLWLFVGKKTNLIYELAIRPYMMAGSDDDKLKLLHALASSDFQFARRFKLADRYTVEFQGTKAKGLMTASGVGPGYEDLDPFQEAFDVIEREMPTRRAGIDGKQTSKAPFNKDNLLHVKTFIQVDENGNQVAQITKRPPPTQPHVAIANLWTFQDERVKGLYALAGRAYMVQGADADKRAILTTLAWSDFYMVNPVPVPDNYSMLIDDEVRKGVIDVTTARAEGNKLFQVVFQAIERDIPTPSIGVEGGEPARAAFSPSNLKLLTTCVIEGDGCMTKTLEQPVKQEQKPWWRFW